MAAENAHPTVSAQQCRVATWDWSWRHSEQAMQYVERTGELPADELAGLIVSLGADVVGSDVAALFDRP